LKCRHCYLGYDGAVRPQKSTKEIERVLDILNELGVLFLVFTGGEPFSRPDFRQLYLKAKQNGFFMTLFSNGTLLDDSLMDFLADAPPRRLELTIYGHSEEVYEAVTGVPGSYKRFRLAVEGLLKRGLLVRLKSMIMRTNAHELDEIREWATGLGCDFRYDALIHPCLNQDTLPLAERLTPAEIAQFRHRDRERRPVPPHMPPSAGGLAPRQFFFECGAGISTRRTPASPGGKTPLILWPTPPNPPGMRTLTASAGSGKIYKSLP
jgi:MoaA/NifB/PqqE/SkfB family radical SAM enzyme